MGSFMNESNDSLNDQLPPELLLAKGNHDKKVIKSTLQHVLFKILACVRIHSFDH